MSMPTPASSSSSSATSASASGGLGALVDGGGTYKGISAHLDALDPGTRLAHVLAVTGKRVGKLYDAVSDAPPIAVDDFFPPDTPDGKTLIFEGRNSLPLFSRFQKRFCKKNGVIVGYNHQSNGWLTGPGYFVLTAGDASHPGEILFDYTLEPPFFPEGWPAYKPNASGVSRLVYQNMKDYCRRVAKGVIVGTAFKGGVAQGAWFSLTGT